MEAGFCCYLIIHVSNVTSFDTYNLPLYFVAKVKIKEEKICISK